MKQYLFILFFLSLLIIQILAQSGRLIPLTTQEKQIITRQHNNLRAATGARNMPPLVYLPSLELWANYSNNCRFAHTNQDFRSNKAGYSYIGENLAWASVLVPVLTHISGWGGELAIWTYGPINIRNFEQTGHYTQQVWATSQSLGCVRVNCTGTGDGGFVLACHYGPGGNYLNQFPYQLCNTSNCAIPSATPGGSPLGSPVSFSATVTPRYTRTASRSRAAPSTTSTATASPSISPSPSCVPVRCSSTSCGTFSNGCGGSINCGSCSGTSSCINNVCKACTPTTTCSNKNCGTVYDSTCQTTQTCGSGNCPSGQTCQNNVCTANPSCSQTCSSLGYTCGTITPAGCSVSISCGSCRSGSSCSGGKCVSTVCNPSCGADSYCSSGVCECNPGYSDKADGNGCTPMDTSPMGFSEVNNQNQFINPVSYALTANNTGSPALNLIANDTSTVFRLSWNNAPMYSSLTRTTFSADMQFNSGRNLGLGLRLGQGPNRETDGIQWTLNLASPSSSNVGLTWNLVWYNSILDYGDQGTLPWSGGSSSWHQVKLSCYTTLINGVNWQVSQLSIDGNTLPSQTVRPFDLIGGAYLYALGGRPSFKNLMLLTSSTVMVTIQKCLSSTDLANLIRNALGSSISNLRVTNVTDQYGRCASQQANFTSNKRQAAAGGEIGTVFTVELSSDTVVSEALVSKLTELGLSFSDAFAATGGIVSIVPAPFPDLTEQLGIVNPVDLSTLTLTPVDPVPVTPDTTTAGGGLTGAQKIGVIIGSVLGGALVLAAVVTLIVFLVVVIRNVVSSRMAPKSLDIQTRPAPYNTYYHTEKATDVVTNPAADIETPGYIQDEPHSARVIVPQDEEEPAVKGVDLYELNSNKRASLTMRLDGRLENL